MNKRLLHILSLVVWQSSPADQSPGHLVALLAGVALCLVGSVVGAQQVPAPGGMLLVAAPAITGLFARAVVLVARTPADETIGVMLNRPVDKPPPAGLPAAPRRVSGVYQGGPLAPAGWLALAEIDEATPDSIAVAPSTRLAVGLPATRVMLNASPAGRQKLFLGYSGWAPGQLEAEIRQGVWLIVPGGAETIFDAQPGTLWARLSAPRRAVRIGPLPTSLASSE